LRTLTGKWESFSAAKAKYGDADSESAKLLGDQINECTSNLGSARQTFEDYAKAQSDRKEVFNNFRADANVDSLDEFKNKLLHHLSSTIVVKENRIDIKRSNSIDSSSLLKLETLRTKTPPWNNSASTTPE
jgi:hypothetical protein